MSIRRLKRWLVLTGWVWLGLGSLAFADVEATKSQVDQAVVVEATVPLALPPLKIGVAPTAPPLIYRDEEGELAGLEVDLALRLCAALGREPVFVEMAFAELIPALLDGKVAIIMSAMSITEMRSLRVAFSQPYLRVGQMPLIRAADLGQYTDLLALLETTGKVGVEAGTTGERLVQEHFSRAERVSYQDIDTVPADLEAGRIDLFITDSPIVRWLANQSEGGVLVPLEAKLTSEYLAWAVSQKNPELLEAVNAFLEAYRESGQLLTAVKAAFE